MLIETAAVGPSGRKVLTLKRKLAAPDDAPLAARLRAATRWMRNNYPYSIGIYKPLATGIASEVFAAGKDFGFSRTILRRAINQHTKSFPYLHWLSQEGAQRHALDGTAVEPVAPEHRAYARERLALREAKRAAE